MTAESDDHDDSVVPQQDEVFVFINEAGGITIRQKSFYDDNDHIVVLTTRAAVNAVIKRLTELAADLEET